MRADVCLPCRRCVAGFGEAFFGVSQLGLELFQFGGLGAKSLLSVRDVSQWLAVDVREECDTHFSIRAWEMSSESKMELLPSGRTSPVERPNMLSRSAAKLWAIEDSGRGGLPLDMIAVDDVEVM